MKIPFYFCINQKASWDYLVCNDHTHNTERTKPRKGCTVGLQACLPLSSPDGVLKNLAEFTTYQSSWQEQDKWPPADLTPWR